MSDIPKTDEERENYLKDTLFRDSFGNWSDVKRDIQSSMSEDMTNQLLRVFGLVGFKLATHVLAVQGNLVIDDKNERTYRIRQTKERIRQKVIDEWRTIGPRDAKSRAIERFSSRFPPGFLSDELIEEIITESLKEVDSWARQALDMTPTVDDLMSNLNATSSFEDDMRRDISKPHPSDEL